MPSTAPSFDETSRICAISVAVVDTRSLAGAGTHCEGRVMGTMHLQTMFTDISAYFPAEGAGCNRALHVQCRCSDVSNLVSGWLWARPTKQVTYPMMALGSLSIFGKSNLSKTYSTLHENYLLYLENPIHLATIFCFSYVFASVSTLITL
jgi:hypothetical protein